MGWLCAASGDRSLSRVVGIAYHGAPGPSSAASRLVKEHIISTLATRRGPRTHHLGLIIFFSRWLQAPLYLGLIVAQGVYVFLFMKELWHLILEANHVNEQTIMIMVLGLVDVVMIANLLIMVIIGGYETFVSRIQVDDHPDQPEWLSHVNANVLKIKLAMAIIGISSIHLLKTFIDVGGSTIQDDVGVQEALSNYDILWQVVIHLTFIVSAIALAWIDRMSLAASRNTHELAQA